MRGTDDKDIIDVQPKPVPDAPDGTLKGFSWASYILHLIVALGAVVPGLQPIPVLLLVALIMDLVKRSDAQGSWQLSHYDWRIRTVGWALFWYVITVPLFFLFLFPGFVAWFIVSVWFLVRIVTGMVALNQNLAVGSKGRQQRSVV